MPYIIRTFRVNRRVKSIRATENLHWSILFTRFLSFQSILEILDSSHVPIFILPEFWSIMLFITLKVDSTLGPWNIDRMTQTTLNVTLYWSDILSHHSRQSTSLSSSFRGLGRFPSTHRTCTPFWNVFSSSSKTVGTSVGRESRRFNTSLLGEQTNPSKAHININIEDQWQWMPSGFHFQEAT